MDHLAQASGELALIEKQITELQQRRDQLRAFVNLGSTLFAAGNGPDTTSFSSLTMTAFWTGNGMRR